MRVFLFFVILSSAGSVYAQSGADSIYISKSLLGYKFYQNDSRINFNQLPELMKNDREAYMLIRTGKKRYVISTVVSGVGGFLIGLQLANTIIGWGPNWTMVAIGGGLVVVSIPIYSSSYRLSAQGVEIYNSHLIAGSGFRPQVILGFSDHGLGLRLLF